MDKFLDRFQPVVKFLKKREVRYILTAVFSTIVIAFYILYEGHRREESVRIIFFNLKTDALVPVGLVFALLAVLLVSWDDKRFKKYRSPGLFLVILTAIFYTLIYSGLDEYIFQIKLAKWMTRLTGIIVPAILKFFGMNITDVSWNEDKAQTYVAFTGPSTATGVIIDSRCSGIHSLTIFIAVFLLMLLESRKSLTWNYKIAVVSFIAVVGTYLINILRVSIIMIVDYFWGWDVAEVVHNYLGYAFLVLWITIFWLFVLSWCQRKEESTTSAQLEQDTDSDDENKEEKIQEKEDEITTPEET